MGLLNNQMGYLLAPSQLNILLVPHDFNRHPPQPPKGPDTIFPNQVLGPVNTLERLLFPYDFNRHPPQPPKGPDTIFPNNVQQLAVFALTTLLVPHDFNRHPPQPPKGPEFIFPNLAIRAPGLPPNFPVRGFVPIDFYRHPPPPPHPIDWMFLYPQMLRVAEVIPPSQVGPFIRNVEPFLTRIRVVGYTLQQIRQLPPLLNK